MIFTPISASNFSVAERLDGRDRSVFNDKRLMWQWQQLSEAQYAHQDIVVNRISEDKQEATGFYRFLNNKRVGIEELISLTCRIEPLHLAGRHILVLGDSTSYNLKAQIGRIKDAERVGVLEDNKTPGFSSHVNLALDATTGSILGLADVLFWCKEVSPVAGNSKQDKRTRQEKESYKWVLGAENSRPVLAPARQLTFIFDRESDNYEVLESLMLAHDHFIIRSKYDRNLIRQRRSLKLYEYLSQAQPLGSYEIDLPALNHHSSTHGHIQRKARTARLEVRACPVSIPVPIGKKASLDALELWAIEVAEIDHNLPKGEEPILWRLLTTHPVETLEQARLIVHYYTLRWNIEQLFRTMKKKGFGLEETQLESFDAILRQTLMAYKLACRVLQLVAARERYDAQPISEVFSQKEQVVLEKLNEKYQGKTQKQQNPYPGQQASWAAWIIARMGGWKGYISQKRPPGPLTMKRGLEKFEAFVQAYELFNSS